MATSIPTCDLCLLLNLSKVAACWCFSCNEYLCDDCELKHRNQKATKDHTPITIDEYQNLPESVTNVKQECSDHNMKYDFYCKDHDAPCCLKCVSNNHKGCTDIQPLEEVIRNVKESFLFDDLQNRIKDIPEVINKLLEDLTTEKSKVNSESQRVFKEIDEARKRINQNLDMLQAKLIEKTKTDQNDMLNKLEQRARSLEKLRATTNQMISDFTKIEKYASNFHTYCSINAMTKEIKQYEDQIDVLQTNSTNSFDSMKLEIATSLLRLTKDVDQFGSIDIHYKKSPVYHFKKEQQGQKVVHNPEIQLSKILSYVIPSDKKPTSVTGCCVTETGEMIFCDNNNTRLVKTTPQGKLIKTIYLSFRPYAVRPVNKSTIAVTSYADRKLVFVNANSGEIEKTVVRDETCFGFCYNDDTFTFCTSNNILETDMQGHVLSKITTDDLVVYCSIMNDKLYYTEHKTDTVFCCDKINGAVLWKFVCEKDDYPLGIVVDKAENVYVACKKGRKVIWIENSGTNSKVVLTEKDGMNDPRSLYFCERNQSLLVCNVNGSCFLYKLH